MPDAVAAMPVPPKPAPPSSRPDDAPSHDAARTADERTGPAEADDAALIASVAAGDRMAFRALFGRYHFRVWGFAQRMLGRPDKADEVAVDTLMAVWKGAAGFEGRSRPSSWIFGIAHRTALKAARQRGVERGKVAMDEAAALPDPRAIPVDVRLGHLEVAAALDDLPAEVRAMLVLVYYGGHSVAEVAAITGLPEGTVKSRMHAARRTLKERLA